MHAAQPADAVVHIGQVPPHGQAGLIRLRLTACGAGSSGKLHVSQIGHHIVRRHIDAVLKAVLQHAAVSLGGRDQVAHLHRRLLSVDPKGTVILAEPVVSGLQPHQVIQLLHSGIAVAAVIADLGGVCRHLRLADDHIRQKEEAHYVGGNQLSHIVQSLLRNIAGIQEAAAAGTAGNSGKDVHIQIGGTGFLQSQIAFGLDGLFQGTGPGDQQVPAHLAYASGALRTQQCVDLIDVHPVHGRVFLDLILGHQRRLQIGVVNGKELLVLIQPGWAAHGRNFTLVRVDGQELNVLIRGDRRIGVIRLQLLIHLPLQLCQCRHTGAADADGQRRCAAVLSGLLTVIDDTAAAVQK